MGWFHEVKSPKLKKTRKAAPSDTPSGIWEKCRNCGELLQKQKLIENQSVCPHCQYHFRLSAEQRIQWLLDKDSFHESYDQLDTTDPLHFSDKQSYQSRLDEIEKKSGRREGTRAGTGTIQGKKIALAVMDFFHLGGSMGVVCGERVAHAFDLAYENHIPVVVVSSSGGARMQEGLVSLMQMAKTTAARSRVAAAGLPFISVLTDPTTGGVAASFAMQGDIIVAEPKALIGFAGPRVIEQTVRQKLPEGFQRSEFLLEHGMIDSICARRELPDKIARLLDLLFYKNRRQTSIARAKG